MWLHCTSFSPFENILTDNDLHNSIDDPRLKDTLHKAFRSRLPEIMDHSQHASTTSSSSVGNIDQQAAAFLAGLDEWEKESEYQNHPTSNTCTTYELYDSTRLTNALVSMIHPVYNAGEQGSRAMKIWTESRRSKPIKFGKNAR